VTDTATNQGADAAGPSVTRFYLSVNLSLDAGDVSLSGVRSVPALSAGASSAGSTGLTIPSGTTPGTYSLIVAADADATVGESYETNNTAARLIQVVTAP
jgi:subtilase family serine protease